jgi:hypothetical protein
MEEMTVSKRKKHDAEGTGVLPRAEIVRDEHPLSLGKTSVWNQYFQVTLMKTKITCWWVFPFLYYMLHSGVWSLWYHHWYCSIVIAHGGPTIFATCLYDHIFNIQILSYTIFLQCEQTYGDSTLYLLYFASCF